MHYGLTQENEKLILNKAKDKSDGCYRFRGVAYRVRKGMVTHFACKNEILERCYYGFNVIIGEYEYGTEYGQKVLLAIK